MHRKFFMCHLLQTSKAPMGRTKIVSKSARQRYKAEWLRKKRDRTVDLGNASGEWGSLKDSLQLSDPELAIFLIDSFKEHEETKRRKLSVPQNTAASPSDEKRSPHIFLQSTPLDNTVTRPFESESELSQLSAIMPVQVKPCVELPMPGTSKQTDTTMENKSITIRVEECTSSEEDAGCTRDPDDPTYEMSATDWDISIHTQNPPDLPASVEDQDIEQVIHDIEDHDEGPALRSCDFMKLQEVTKDAEEDRMVLVSMSCLQVLLEQISRKTSCDKCHQCPVQMTVRHEGCGMKIRWICKKGHEQLAWGSQPIMPRGIMFGNAKLASAVTLSGNNFTKIALLFKFLRIGMPSKSFFTQLQSLYVVPVVQEVWTEKKLSAQEEHRASNNLVVAGDGRMDSPGHSAKYCTYTVMNQDDKQILAMEIIDKREVGLVSNRMELQGFERALTDLHNSGVSVSEVVTDAHPSITSVMKKQHPEIRHSYDMWHGAKNLGKKLCAISSERGNQKLKPWIGDITNHFYHSAEKCQSQVPVFKDKLLSVLHHCTNEHSWALGACEHEDIDEDQQRTKEWLSPTGKEMASLRQVLTEKRFLNTLPYYVTCQTTAEIESFNNHLLMYVSKRQAFSYPVYQCRCQIAALDYMHHLNRPLKKTKEGKFCYKRQFSKGSNRWVCKHVKVEKTYSHIPDLLIRITNNMCLSDRPLFRTVEPTAADPVKLSKTIAPVPPPATEEIVAATKPRLEKLKIVKNLTEVNCIKYIGDT